MMNIRIESWANHNCSFLEVIYQIIFVKLNICKIYSVYLYLWIPCNLSSRTLGWVNITFSLWVGASPCGCPGTRTNAVPGLPVPQTGHPQGDAPTRCFPFSF